MGQDGTGQDGMMQKNQPFGAENGITRGRLVRQQVEYKAERGLRAADGGFQAKKARRISGPGNLTTARFMQGRMLVNQK